MFSLVGWLILFVLCWPLALLALRLTFVGAHRGAPMIIVETFVREQIIS